MKKLNELIALRATKNDVFQELELTDETREAFDALENEIKSLDSDIERLERQEATNKRLAALNINTKTRASKDEAPNFLENLQKYARGASLASIDEHFRGDKGILYRDNPIVTTTDPDAIIKQPGRDVVIMKSANEQMLMDLGVTIYRDLVGNLPIHASDELIAGTVAEGAPVPDANTGTTSVVLTAKRTGHSLGRSNEFIAQGNPLVWQSLLNELYDGVWAKIAQNYYDGIIAAGTAHAVPTPVDYADVIAMEALIPYVNIQSPAYLTTFAEKAVLKGTPTFTNGSIPVWMDNEVNGYKAFASNRVTASTIIFADFAKTFIGTWGDMQIIVDPYTLKKEGEVEFTVSQLADVGLPNNKAAIIGTIA